jgi:C-terminal processing protease CtpA/Prc
MTVKEVIDRLLKKVSPEIRCTIERTVDVKVDQDKKLFSGPEGLIGASLSMEFDGLTVSKVTEGGAAWESGLKEGDLIVAINGNSTRYMPLKKAVEDMRRSDGNVKFSIRRDMLIWRKD